MSVKCSVARVATLSTLLGLSATSQAASISYYLNQSNADSALPDGANYVLVTIDDNVANALTFTVTPLAPLTSIAGSNFGIDSFAFNVAGTNPLQDFGSVTGQWTLPSGWSASVAPPPNQADGFGRFEVQVDGTGSGRVGTLTFTINNTPLTLYSFAEASTNGNGQGNVYFAAHIAGISASGGVTSGYFGGSTVVPVPLPAALPLLMSSLGLFGGLLGRRAAA